MAERAKPIRRPLAPRVVPVRARPVVRGRPKPVAAAPVTVPEPTQKSRSRAATPIPLPPPRGATATDLSPGLRLVAWAFLFGGFAGLAAALGGSLVLAHDVEAFAPQRDLRFGLVVGTAGVLALDALAIAAGLQLLLVREWGRLAAVVLCVVGLLGCAVAAGVAYFGGLLGTWAPAPTWLVGTALIATISAGVFFGWALPLLLDPPTVELFQSNEARRGARALT